MTARPSKDASGSSAMGLRSPRLRSPPDAPSTWSPLQPSAVTTTRRRTYRPARQPKVPSPGRNGVSVAAPPTSTIAPTTTAAPTTTSVRRRRPPPRRRPRFADHHRCRPRPLCRRPRPRRRRPALRRRPLWGRRHRPRRRRPPWPRRRRRATTSIAPTTTATSTAPASAITAVAPSSPQSPNAAPPLPPDFTPATPPPTQPTTTAHPSTSTSVGRSDTEALLPPTLESPVPVDGSGPLASRRRSVKLIARIPRDVDWGPAATATGISLTLLILFLVRIPATLVNATLERHYDRIVAPVSRLVGVLDAVDRVMATWHSASVIGVFAVASALVTAHLDPDFGLNATSVVLLAALVTSSLVVAAVTELLRCPVPPSPHRVRQLRPTAANRAARRSTRSCAVEADRPQPGPRRRHRRHGRGRPGCRASGERPQHVAQWDTGSARSASRHGSVWGFVRRARRRP